MLHPCLGQGGTCVFGTPQISNYPYNGIFMKGKRTLLGRRTGCWAAKNNTHFLLNITLREIGKKKKKKNSTLFSILMQESQGIQWSLCKLILHRWAESDHLRFDSVKQLWNRFGFKVQRLLGTIPLIQFHTVSWAVWKTVLSFSPSRKEN